MLHYRQGPGPQPRHSSKSKCVGTRSRRRRTKRERSSQLFLTRPEDCGEGLAAERTPVLCGTLVVDLRRPDALAVQNPHENLSVLGLKDHRSGLPAQAQPTWLGCGHVSRWVGGLVAWQAPPTRRFSAAKSVGHRQPARHLRHAPDPPHVPPPPAGGSSYKIQGRRPSTVFLLNPPSLIRPGRSVNAK